MHPMEIKSDEYARLKQAKELKKYSHLMTWKELYLFQRTIATPEQNEEIAEYAARKNKAEKIILPLKIQKQLDTEQEKLI
jgi:hypothetical protein